jgi:hypothetical protein
MYPFQPVMAGEGCSELKSQIQRSINNGFAYLATAVSDRGLTLMFTVKQTGEWQIIGVDNDLSACVVAQGTDWVFAMERAL